LIDSELEAAGYHVERFCLNSADYGVPQLRERLYLVGVRNDLLETASKIEELLPGIMHTHRDVRPRDPRESIPRVGHVERREETVAEASLPARLTLGQILEDTDSEEHALTEHQWSKIMEGNEYKKDPEYRFCKPAGQARTLTSNYKTGYLWHTEFVRRSEGSTPRFFTPRECARIMGFPESFDVTHNVNQNRFYHQIGNAVCPPVIHAIMKRLLEVHPICGRMAEPAQDSHHSCRPAKAPRLT